MESCEQQDQAQYGDADALEDAQRTRLDPQLVLDVIGVGQHGSADRKPN
jgi:hypothetical protein